MSYHIGAVILAAGKGTRMKMDVAKPLVPFLEGHLVDFPIRAAQKFFDKLGQQSHLSIVTGHQKEQVESYLKVKLGEKVSFAFQKEQKGTADALRTYFDQCSEAKNCKYTLVMCADTPLLQATDLEKLYQHLEQHELDGVAATFIEEREHRYGRIFRSTQGSGFHIVEDKDATPKQKENNEVNAALYLLKTDFVLKHLYEIDSNNKAGEFYLTDLFQDHLNVQAILFDNKEAFWGVNDLAQLNKAERAYRQRKMHTLREEGVRFVDISHTYIYEDAEVEAGAVIYPNVIIQGSSKISSGAVIGAGCVITDSFVGANVKVKPYSILEEARIDSAAEVGPYARLRPGAVIGSEAKVGNFVEIKKAELKKGAKVSHLSYVGDAEIGEDTNIGCGFITCNYDGGEKHQTKIGKNCFIGSDTQTIAPIEIADNCYVASGSTLTQSIEEGSFAVARSRQATKPSLARRFMKGKYLERLLNKLS